MKLKIIAKSIFAIFLAFAFLFLTQIKFSPILGTKMSFSLAVFLGPTLAKIFGIQFGTLTIILTQILGTILGFLKFEGAEDVFTFFPIIFGGIFFAKIFKKEKKILFLPSISILAFLLHPIGRQVWFYSLFWTIPIFLFFFKIPKFTLFSNSLASSFADHAVGSVIYLYLLNIPAHFWIQAIPLTIIERLFIGAGISLCYVLERAILKILLKIPFLTKIKALVFA